MDNYKPKDDTEENNANFFESVLVKLHAHKNYIVRHIKEEGRKLQAEISFDTIIKHIYSAKEPIPPEKIKRQYFLVADSKTHKNVLDTYKDIYYNMYKRYYGRSEDFYLEKV